MKFNTLAVATTLAMAGLSTQAFAVQTLSSASDTPDVTIYLSGASAPDAFLSSISAGMFNSGYYVYVDNAGGTSFSGYFGVTKNDASIPVALRDKKVKLIKRSAGGSVWGVNPVARAQGIRTMSTVIGGTGCTLSSGAAGAVAGTYACPIVGSDANVADPANAVPDFGVSDVNPKLFKGLNNEFGFSPLSAAEVAVLTVKGANTVMMGYPITNSIPNSTYVNKSLFGSLLKGDITTWSTLGVATPAAGDQVIVCRRTPGSGTQSMYNLHFSNFPCSTNSTEPARMDVNPAVSGTGTSADPFVIDPTLGYTVLENAGSGDVRNCLAKAQAGGVHTFKDEQGKSYSVNFGTGGYGAIGVLSVDSHGKESGWTFRNVDGAGELAAGVSTSQVVVGTGVAPTQANLIEGNYEFSGEATYQYRSGLSGLKKAFADEFIKRAGAPAFQSKWTAALPSDTNIPDGVLAISKASHFGDMCAPLQRQF